MAVNEKYSFKSHKRKKFTNEKPEDFNDSEIVAASFHQDTPYNDVFPSGIKNVEFVRCNLDNCTVPGGAVVKDGTNKQFSLQNDQEFWIVDEDLKPVTPRDGDRFVKCGLSTDPKDISGVKASEPVTYTNDPGVIEQKKISELAENPVRLKAILVEKGELPAAANHASGR